jgi:hypothetical protein
MSLRQNRNITTSLVGKASVLTSALPAVGATVTPANLPIGGLVLVGLDNKRISSLTTGQDFRIAQGQGSDKPLLLTPVLNQARISKSVGAHRAARQQITMIGYNPATATGSLPTANDTSYFIKIRKNDNDSANNSQPNSMFAQFKTDATGTQKELAFGLAANGVKNFKDEPANGYLRFEVTSDGTAAVVTDGTQTQDAIVVKGSRVITLVDTGTSTAGNTAGIATSIPVGTLLFLAGATYEVISLSANTATLNMAYVGEDATLTGNTTYASGFGKLSAVTNYGIRLTGVASPFDVNRFRNYYTHRFTATFSDPTVAITHVQGAFDGVGVWQKVAMDEYMTYGFEGQNEMLNVPPTARYSFVQSAATDGATDTNKYSAYQIEFSEPIGHLVSTGAGKGSVIVYLNLDQTAPGEIPALAAEAALVTALGGTVADFDEIV